MTKCFGYVRVSTAKQGEGVSLTEQREAILRYGSRHGISITRWFEEKETAAKRGRPIFREVLRRLRKREAHGLVIHKIDRSARNLRDWADLNEFIDKGMIHFAHESLDLTTRGGRLAADIQAVVAADYIRNLSDETKKGHYGRLRQGIYPFRAPLGYSDEGPGRPKAVDPAVAPFIQQAFELYDSGDYSLETLSDELYRRGLRTRGGSRIYKPYLAEILHNAFYTGVMTLRSTGEIFPGKHTLVISPRLFESVQARLAGKAVRGPAQHLHLFRRLFRCAYCGRYLVGERQKGHVYYRCHQRACPSQTVREDLIEEHLQRLFLPLRFHPTELEWLRHRIQANCEQAKQSAVSAVTNLERDLGAMKSRLARLTSAFVDGDVDRHTYAEVTKAIHADRAAKLARLQELCLKPDLPRQRVLGALELAASAQRTYESGTPAHQRELVEILCSNRTLKGKRLSVELAFPFSDIAFSPCSTSLSNDQDKVRTEGGKNGEPVGLRGKKALRSLLTKLYAWVERQEELRKTKRSPNPTYLKLCGVSEHEEE